MVKNPKKPEKARKSPVKAGFFQVGFFGFFRVGFFGLGFLIPTLPIPNHKLLDLVRQHGDDDPVRAPPGGIQL